MSDSPFDDQQSVNGCLSHLAKIRLEDIEPTKKPIRGIHVTVLASSYGNGPVGSQRSERFRTVKKPERYGKRDAIQIMSAQGAGRPDRNEIIGVHQIVNSRQVATLVGEGQQPFDRRLIF